MLMSPRTPGGTCLTWSSLTLPPSQICWCTIWECRITRFNGVQIASPHQAQTSNPFQKSETHRHRHHDFGPAATPPLQISQQSLNQWNSTITLSTVLDLHAPLKTRTVSFSRSAPWFTSELRSMKAAGRVLEQRLARSRLTVHRLSGSSKNLFKVTQKSTVTVLLRHHQ